MSATLTREARPWRVEARVLSMLAAPIIIGKLCLMGQNTVDVLLAGHLSAHTLGAVAMGSGVWWLAQMLQAGLLMAVSPFVSQMDGAGRRREVGPLFIQALWVASVVGIFLMAVVRWVMPEVVAVMGVAPALLPDVRRFLHAIAYGAPAVGILTACMGLSEGLSMPRPSMVVGIGGLVVLAPLGALLMYGGFGLPSLGAEGSGTANAVVMWLQALAFLGWIAVSRRYAGLGWPGLLSFRRWWPDAARIGAIFRVGGPIAVSSLLESALFTTAGLLIGRFGTEAAASHLIALNVGALTFMVPLGIAFATTVRVGLAVGRDDRAGVRRSGFCGIGMALLAQAIAACVLLSIPETIAQLYSTDPVVVGRTTILLRLAGIFQLSDGLQVAAMSALRGLKDTAAPMLVSAVAYWGVGLPVALLCAFALGMEAPGIWLGLIAGLTVAAGLLAARFIRLTR